MSTARRRLAVVIIMIMALAAMVAVSLSPKTSEKAEAAFRCPAPVVTWEMLSQWPSPIGAAMSTSWIDLAHRPSGGVHIQGTFAWNEITQYRWCLDGRNPKFTGHIQAYRTQLCVMFRGWAPSGVRSVKWQSQGVYWPSLTAGKRQWYKTAESTFKFSKSPAAKGHWQCQQRAISAPWVAIATHPQRQVWGYNDIANAKDKHWHMYDNDKWLPWNPATDKRNILR